MSAIQHSRMQSTTRCAPRRSWRRGPHRVSTPSDAEAQGRPDSVRRGRLPDGRRDQAPRPPGCGPVERRSQHLLVHRADHAGCARAEASTGHVRSSMAPSGSTSGERSRRSSRRATTVSMAPSRVGGALPRAARGALGQLCRLATTDRPRVHVGVGGRLEVLGHRRHELIGGRDGPPGGPRAPSAPGRSGDGHEPVSRACRPRGRCGRPSRRRSSRAGVRPCGAGVSA